MSDSFLSGIGEQYLTGALCGPTNGNQKCPYNTCCSKYGYCGSSSEHCRSSQGCQAGFGQVIGVEIVHLMTLTCMQCGLPGASNEAVPVEPWPQWTPFNGRYLNGCPLGIA